MGARVLGAVVAAGAAVAVLIPAAGEASAAGRPAGASLAAAGNWANAQEVRGIAALNTGGNAFIESMSCASTGNCSAGGGYTNGGAVQAFVVSQVRGAWGKAKEVPGTGVLNTGGTAFISSVSCASAGNCSAAGQYADGDLRTQAFVVSQVGGVWGKAKEVPGLGVLNTQGDAQVLSLSCASAGNCTAGGFYLTSSGAQAFVVSQVRGAWGKAAEVPGTATLNAGVESVSCVSAGNCRAGGYYTDSSHHNQAFIVSQVAGTWGKAKQVPGLAVLNTGGGAEIGAVSCASAGNCSAGGD